MFELVRNARVIWAGVLDVAGLFPTEANQQESVAASAQVVRDTPPLAAAVCATVHDNNRRTCFYTKIAFLAEHAADVLGR
jgi:Na+-transporting methylmalonyl-CoA/oxaloacetate decarboxylase gamma subunit